MVSLLCGGSLIGGRAASPSPRNRPRLGWEDILTAMRLALFTSLFSSVTLLTAAPAASEDEAYVAKYHEQMGDLGMTPESFAADYPIRIHVHPTRLRAS